MMMFIADFHIHSKYSMATSKDCVPEALDYWAHRKGIGVIGTGDFTHRAWREELKEKLVATGEGLYTLKDEYCQRDDVAGVSTKPRFIVSGEISCIYKKNGRVRKVHNLIILPSLEIAELIARRLETIGNVHSDGRPILGLDSKDLLAIVLELCPEAIFIPAHIWTPHFSVYGAYSGFDDIKECFEDLTSFIYAVETGLSSDPPMNWRLSALDNYTLVSNSDAHSPEKLGREANIFHTGQTYQCIANALQNRNTDEFHGTIEFFPEEGKYHYDGHRACKVCWQPADTRAAGGKCPVCGRRITKGVLHRVEALADREAGFVPPGAKPFESLVPLNEVIAASIGYTPGSKMVKNKYNDLIHNLGQEFFILREASLSDIELAAGPCVAEGVRRLRTGKVEIKPGFDGQYGIIKIMDKSEIDLFAGQMCLFPTASKYPAVAGASGEGKCSGKKSMGVQVCAEDINNQKGSKDVVIAAAGIPYGLNEEQWEAVSSANRVIAVIAGPGTGKTKTLVSRIIYLIERYGVLPEQVTAVTFTNKAAQEMRTRLHKHFQNKRFVDKMSIGTFHSLCLQILRQYRGKDNVILIDEYNGNSLIEEIINDLGLKISPPDVKRELSLFKSGGTERNNKELQLPAAVYERYCAVLRDFGALDYDDILREALFEYRQNKAANSAAKGKENPFLYLLVDEFQDINEVQYQLVNEWGKESKGIFIIGDPDQSIYGFRGSNAHYFARFKADFPDIHEIRLNRNYRSTPEIISAAKSVMAVKTAGDAAGSLNTIKQSGAKVRLVETKNKFSEALFIAKEINRQVGGIDMLATDSLAATGREAPEQRGFSDFAILYRTNRQGDILEQCLTQEGIPYIVAGRDEFLSHKLVREAIAFFRFLLNPGDIASLSACLNLGDISAGEKQKIMESYIAGKRSVSDLVKIIETIQPAPRHIGRSANFPALLQKYKRIINEEKPGKVIAAWINDNGFAGMQCMELFLNMAIMYDKMSSLMHNLVLGRERDIVRSGSKVYCSDAVTLMTLHGAKGLEFPVVFIAGVDNGLIPFSNSKHRDIDPEEERRLFYVGMTRAEDELILLTSGCPSPFIAHLPAEQLIREKPYLEKQGPHYKQTSLFDH
jgi:uncharacterized protein (TIGR00375 family)